MKRVELSKEEIAERGQHLGQLIQMVKGEQEAKRNDNAEYNENIKALEKQISELAQVVRTGVEFVEDDVLPFESSARAS